MENEESIVVERKAPAWLPWLTLLGALAIVGVWYQSPIWSAKDNVRELLFDPGAAEFRNVRRGERGAICGEVNAKNRFGAYRGFVPFFVDQSGVANVQPPEGLALFHERWRQHCR